MTAIASTSPLPWPRSIRAAQYPSASAQTSKQVQNAIMNERMNASTSHHWNSSCRSCKSTSAWLQIRRTRMTRQE
eukprot:480218-Prymnesium_polylepis.1